MLKIPESFGLPDGVAYFLYDLSAYAEDISGVLPGLKSELEALLSFCHQNIPDLPTLKVLESTGRSFMILNSLFGLLSKASALWLLGQDRQNLAQEVDWDGQDQSVVWFVNWVWQQILNVIELADKVELTLSNYHLPVEMVNLGINSVVVGLMALNVFWAVVFGFKKEKAVARGISRFSQKIKRVLVGQGSEV